MSADLKPLKPCPFCGSHAELLHTKAWDYFVRCTDKGCAARTRQYHENDAGAVNAWNTRAERTCKLRNLPGGYYATTAVQCSECHAVIATTDREWECCEISYCPNCGRKVER